MALKLNPAFIPTRKCNQIMQIEEVRKQSIISKWGKHNF